MPLNPPTFDEVVLGIRQQLTSLGFTAWTEGSAINAIVKSFSAYLVDLWGTLADLEQQVDPSTARGVYLDRIGAFLGVPRLPPQVASTLGKGASVRFTNNGVTAVTVPTNTRVWSGNNPDIAFFTTRTLSLAGGQAGFVDVLAGSAGEEWNIGANSLDSHNAGMVQISVTNVTPIGGGSFYESDDAYRFRIENALLAKNGATETALIQALLQVPGIRDVLIHEGARGNGTVDITVIPIDRFASPALLDAASQAVANTIAAGISFRIDTPKVVQVDVTVQLRLADGADLATVAPLVEAAVRGYLDNLSPNTGQGNSDLIYNELLSRAISASDQILDLALQIALDGAPSLAGNVTPDPGSRLVSGAVQVV